VPRESIRLMSYARAESRKNDDSLLLKGTWSTWVAFWWQF